MSDIGSNNFRTQFDQNFERDTAVTPQDKAQAETKGKGKDGATSGVGAEAPGNMGSTDPFGNVTTGESVSGENLSQLYLVAMMTAYNSQATDMMNKSDQMQQQNEQATQMSQAENAVTSAQLAANGGSIEIKITSSGPAYSTGTNPPIAYITQGEAEMMSNSSLDIPTGIGATLSVSADDISSLTSSMNDIQQTQSGNSEYTLLELQMDTQNMQQDSSLATSGLKTIGEAQSSAAQNV